MKQSLLLIFLTICFSAAHAIHIKGGWIQYEYKGPSATTGKSDYKITVYVFRSCVNNGPMPSAIGIYDAVTNAPATVINTLANAFVLTNTANKTSFDPCINNPPSICYQIYTYSTTVSLTDNVNGYIIAAEDANRIAGIVNITNSSSTGISFTATIPGTISGTDYHVNNSPYFEFKDTAIICYSTNFSYQFAATDADGDSLSYAFGDGLNGASGSTAPPYKVLNYANGYSGSLPLGSTVKIDPSTGLISGTAPNITGEFVIAVYVSEWRNGVKINTTKKELQINVANCTLTAASLKPLYINCNDYSFNFQNESSSIINSYLWNFGETISTTNISSAPTPSHTYKDTGTYTLKLVVANAGGCKDSATSTVKVYPTFIAHFAAAGSCFQAPFLFTDKSIATSGSISSWTWDFGDSTVTTDTSSLQNPSYQYPGPGSYTVKLNITSSKGCSATDSSTVTVNKKPYIYVPFTDTLICSIDSLPLTVQTSGSVRWSPNYNITGTTLNNPIVFPKDTTTYKVVVTDKGCLDSATVQVNVLQFIKVDAGVDRSICQTDTIQLHPISDALSYRWTSSTNVPVDNIKYPQVQPLTTTTYYVTANLGKCQDYDSVKIAVYPYPIASIQNKDTTICYGNKLPLHGTVVGTNFSWTPTSSMLNANSLNPIVGPTQSTTYILSAGYASGCLKTISDTIHVSVSPLFSIDAGKDTAVVINQPLQLKASGDTTLSYQWFPPTGLSNPLIYNPIAQYSASDADSIKYTVVASTPFGCTATDDIWVKIFKMSPDILVPSAFTPNNDNRNDILKPILIGVTQLHYFNIYNRWGQLIFSTNIPHKGWDGTLNNLQQASGTYVFTVEGVDYLGNTITKKGTVVLIR